MFDSLRFFSRFCLWSLCLCLASCGGGGEKDEAVASGDDPETLVRGGYDAEEMDAAIHRARSEVDTFIEALDAGQGNTFSVKAAIEDGGEVEHFWLTDVAYRDGEFRGVIGNEPGVVTNVEFGQEWTVAREEITDWMFLRDERIHGNYTIRPLLSTMPEDEAAFWRSKLANP